MSLGDVFIARQPIFDRRNVVSGYEILFRSGPENRFLASDIDLAASQSLERSLMSFGFEELTSGQPAFVNVSQRVLLSELYTLLPARKAVIELLETVAPTAEVIHACERLKGAGYRLALDDFVYQASLDPLLELADVVKIDFRQDESRSEKSIALASRYGAKLLAEKVETQEERAEADQLGFELFQGYFFCQPELIRSKMPGPSRANYLRLLKEVGQRDLEFDRIEAIIRQEVAFSIRLLRYLNSAGFGWRHEVDTINHALRLLGVRQVQKWVSAVATVGLGEGKPPELVATALLRARLAELLAEPVGLSRADLQLFFTGLFSVMDAVMDQPLDEVVGSMGLSPEVAAGLLRREPPFGPVIDLIVAQERGEWDRMEALASRLGAPADQVQQAYRAASTWASSLLKAA
jgi:EAL and modified HD-GYP domain-containing signal transduction protein